MFYDFLLYCTVFVVWKYNVVVITESLASTNNECDIYINIGYLFSRFQRVDGVLAEAR